MKSGIRNRKIVQILWGCLTNGYLKGFANGTIYRGGLKNFCVPGMNCYSCPGALAACPVGAMQAVLDGRQRKFAFYVAGYLATIGLVIGRFVCGWLCLFGLIQELLYKIPSRKLNIPPKPDKYMRYCKYAILVILVILLPLLYRDEVGSGTPFFCKLVCPVGTLEAGIPLVVLNEGMRAAVGFLYHRKLLVLAACVISSVFIYRPFCKYICPLGAVYSLFNKVSIVRLGVDEGKCVHCGSCSSVCHMNVDPAHTPNSPECIRCGACINACPVDAIKYCVFGKKQRKGEKLSDRFI